MSRIRSWCGSFVESHRTPWFHRQKYTPSKAIVQIAAVDFKHYCPVRRLFKANLLVRMQWLQSIVGNGSIVCSVHMDRCLEDDGRACGLRIPEKQKELHGKLWRGRFVWSQSGSGTLTPYVPQSFCLLCAGHRVGLKPNLPLLSYYRFSHKALLLKHFCVLQ